jgi:hypothetical protein
MESASATTQVGPSQVIHQDEYKIGFFERPIRAGTGVDHQESKGNYATGSPGFHSSDRGLGKQHSIYKYLSAIDPELRN